MQSSNWSREYRAFLFSIGTTDTHTMLGIVQTFTNSLNPIVNVNGGCDWCLVPGRNGDSCVSPSFQFDSICFIRIGLTYNWMAFGITLTILFSAIFCLITAKFRLNRELKTRSRRNRKKREKTLRAWWTHLRVCVGLTETNLDVSDNTKLLCSINAPNTYHERWPRAREPTKSDGIKTD